MPAGLAVANNSGTPADRVGEAILMSCARYGFPQIDDARAAPRNTNSSTAARRPGANSAGLCGRCGRDAAVWRARTCRPAMDASSMPTSPSRPPRWPASKSCCRLLPPWWPGPTSCRAGCGRCRGSKHAAARWRPSPWCALRSWSGRPARRRPDCACRVQFRPRSRFLRAGLRGCMARRWFTVQVGFSAMPQDLGAHRVA